MRSFVGPSPQEIGGVSFQASFGQFSQGKGRDGKGEDGLSGCRQRKETCKGEDESEGRAEQRMDQHEVGLEVRGHFRVTRKGEILTSSEWRISGGKCKTDSWSRKGSGHPGSFSLERSDVPMAFHDLQR